MWKQAENNLAATNRDLFVRGSFQMCLQCRILAITAQSKCLVARLQASPAQPSNAAACWQTYSNDHDAVVQEPKPNEGQRIVQQHCGRGTNGASSQAKKPRLLAEFTNHHTKHELTMNILLVVRCKKCILWINDHILSGKQNFLSCGQM